MRDWLLILLFTVAALCVCWRGSSWVTTIAMVAVLGAVFVAVVLLLGWVLASTYA